MNATSAPNTTVLTSWKDIARYMGKGVRTVQRWEQDFGLPVRRPQGSNKKAVLARPRDLDAWVALRCSSRSQTAVVAALPAPRNGASEGRATQQLEALCTLSAQIETSRMLRADNQVILSEIRTAVETLKQQLFSLMVQSESPDRELAHPARQRTGAAEPTPNFPQNTQATAVLSVPEAMQESAIPPPTSLCA